MTPATAALRAYDPPAVARPLIEAMGCRVEFVERLETDTQGFAAWNDEQVLVAFRGTESIRDLLHDLTFRKTPYPFGGKVHQGFYRAAESVFDQVIQIVKRLKGRRIIVCGHSLGAALAAITAHGLRRKMIRIHAVYLFGCPRVFNAAAADTYDSDLPSTYRYFHNCDVVPRVPPAWMGYRHIGVSIYVDRLGKMRWRVTPREILADRMLGRLTDPFGGLTDHDMEDYRRLVGGLV